MMPPKDIVKCSPCLGYVGTVIVDLTQIEAAEPPVEAHAGRVYMRSGKSHLIRCQAVFDRLIADWDKATN